jgi:DnaK suppressor protein
MGQQRELDVGAGRGAMNAVDLEDLRTRLQRRRRDLLEATRSALAAIDQLRRAERDPEVEEASQSEQLQYDLSQLDEAQERELVRIDAALARMDAGQYGRCARCGEPIAPARLSALPLVLECAECASGREEAEALEREAKKRSRLMSPG